STKAPSPEPIHDDTDTVSDRETPEENEEVRALKAENARLQNALDEQNGVRQIFSKVKYWTDNYVERNTAALAKLPPDDKQSILRSLEGYCVQDLDWDTFIGSLPYPICNSAPRHIARCMLVKDIIEKFFENPFWYFEGKTEQGEEFPQHLQHLFQQFLEANPESATLWKTETVRLANSITKDQAPNTKLGIHTKRRREDAARSFASAMLASLPLRMLLAKREASNRDEELVTYYAQAQELAICLGQSCGICEYTNLGRLSSPLFSHRSENMKAHPNHSLWPDDPRLDGRRILFITQPAVSRLRGTTLTGIEERWAPIEAVIEDGEMSQEQYEKMLKKQRVQEEEEGQRIWDEISKRQAEWNRIEKEQKENRKNRDE
ncbi:hypothetical protein BO78DRAFT_282328, partial [Aspergillus sclerotiicarbonarius CBS 121057]